MDQGQDIYAKAFAELTGIDAEIAALEKRRMALRQFVELGQRLFASHGQPTSDASGDSISLTPVNEVSKEDSPSTNGYRGLKALLEVDGRLPFC